jgi:hypothetical protein
VNGYECGAPEAPGPVRPDPDLIAAGWTARFLCEPGRVDEMTAVYTNAGFQVCTAPVRPGDFDEKCGTCPSVVCRTFVLIYTRRS